MKGFHSAGGGIKKEIYVFVDRDALSGGKVGRLGKKKPRLAITPAPDLIVFKKADKSELGSKSF